MRHFPLPAAPLALLVLTLAGCGLAGCSAFGGEDSGDLAPGTFQFTADGETYTGTATYRPNTDTNLARARVFLIASGNYNIQITTDQFLSAKSGSQIDAFATAYISSSYQSKSGEVRVISASDSHIEGRFRFRLEESGSGPIRGSDITAEGGFYALLAED